MSLVAGIAMGNWVAGVLVESGSWQRGCLAAAGAASVAAVLAALRWRTLSGGGGAPVVQEAAL